MNQMLRLTLLGSPRILIDSEPITGFATTKSQALLFYLAVTARPHSRDHLSTLLWEDMTSTQAKKNLRSILPDLRRYVGAHLQIDRQIISFDIQVPYWLDVKELYRSLAEQQTAVDLAERHAAIDIYHGEFLSGFHVHNAPNFDSWVLEQREQLHALMVRASTTLIDDYIELSKFDAALSVNRRLLILEPWSEPIHRQRMLILAKLGNRSAAIAQYDECRQIIADEFGVEPLPETTALYEQIRAGELSANSVDDAQQASPLPHMATAKAEITPDRIEPEAGLDASHRESVLPSRPNAPTAGQNLPHEVKLFGRETEQKHLRRWIMKERSRLIGIFGIGGQGKTALAASLVRAIAAPASIGNQQNFDHILWCSLLNAPPPSDLMPEWFYTLSKQTVTTPLDGLDQQLKLLTGYLRDQRCLLVLDNFESILGGDNDRSGYYRPGYEGYGQLLQTIIASNHNSSLLITSREYPHDLVYVQAELPNVRFLDLYGIPVHAGRQMMAARGVQADAAEMGTLVQHYSGNPLALKIVTETVDSLFNGNISDFLQASGPIFDDIRDVLDQQFARLSTLEREILVWLAIVREPVPFPTLQNLFISLPLSRLMLEAVRSLQRRSLLESYEGGMSLQNVVMEYATDWLVYSIYEDLLGNEGESEESIQKHSDSLVDSSLNRYALILTQTKEYIRASQRRLHLQPVAKQLVSALREEGVAKRIEQLLSALRNAPRQSSGYAAANLLHLALASNVDLQGYDFSKLYLRQLYLRGVRLARVNFSQSKLVDSVFTEPFGLVYAVAISPDGRYLAAGTSEGAIYLWRTNDQQLTQVMRIHSQIVLGLTFTQSTNADDASALLLASASEDATVCVVSIDDDGQILEQRRIVHEEQKAWLNVGFGTSSQSLTAVDSKGRAFVWDISSPQQSHLIQQFDTIATRYRLVVFSRDGQTLVIGNREGLFQQWDTKKGEMVTQVMAEASLTISLALSPDGETVATGDRDGCIRLWNIALGTLEHEVQTTVTSIDALAFSPDGQMLASTHGVNDHAVRLWTIDRQKRLHLQQTYLGHTHIIWSVAFGPTPQPATTAGATAQQQLLMTGSSDQTVRVWDAQTGHALYTRTGQPRALAAISMSQPPENLPSSSTKGKDEFQNAKWLLATASYDQSVYLWSGQKTSVNPNASTFHGSSNALYAIAFSPDGRFIASGGHDKQIYIWDTVEQTLAQTLKGHTDNIEAIVFYPLGYLLASGAVDGTIRIWDLSFLADTQSFLMGGSTVAQSLTVLETNHHSVYHMDISSDGHTLASVGRDPSVHLWDVSVPHSPRLIATRSTDEQNMCSVAISPDGSKLACGGMRKVHLWTLTDAHVNGLQVPRDETISESATVLEQHSLRIMAVTFSPDSSLLASAGDDYTVCLWDLADSSLRAMLKGHTEPVFDLCFSTDGATLLSCSADGTIRFWDIETGQCARVLEVDGPYKEMNLSEIKGISNSQLSALQTLGAVM